MGQKQERKSQELLIHRASIYSAMSSCLHIVVLYPLFYKYVYMNACKTHIINICTLDGKAREQSWSPKLAQNL